MENDTEHAEPRPNCPSPDDCLVSDTRCAACSAGSEYEWDPASASAGTETPKGKRKRKKKENKQQD